MTKSNDEIKIENLLKELSKVYTKLDKLTIENKILKNDIKRLKKLSV
jgi:hypothetical protein